MNKYRYNNTYIFLYSRYADILNKLSTHSKCDFLGLIDDKQCTDKQDWC